MSTTPRVQKPRPFCYWTEGFYGVWVTDCDNGFQFSSDGPKQNSFRFCPYCGKPLKVRP